MAKNILFVIGGVVVGVVIMMGMSFVNGSSQNSAASVKPAASSPKPTPTFSFDPEIPPKESLVGNILSLNGEVRWKGRVATEAGVIKEVQKIQQGEELETGEDGKVVVEFPEVLKVTALPETHLNFAQTLPINLVLVQTKGSVEYQVVGESKLSVRSRHLLIESGNGDLLVSIDEDNNLVTVSSRKGQSQIAFNDQDNLTNVVDLEEGKRFIFDDEEKAGKIR